MIMYLSVSISEAKYEFQNCHKFLWQIIKQQTKSRVGDLSNWMKHINSAVSRTQS